MKIKTQNSKLKTYKTCHLSLVTCHTRLRRVGFSLIELLVVISVFSILAIMATQSLLLSLRGSRKSEALSRVRENLDYSLAVMERQLHNAKSVDCPSSTEISYYDYDGNPTTFSCLDIDGSGGNPGYIASGSARLTISEIDITQCNVTCNVSDGLTSSITISLSAEDITTEGTEGAQITTQTNISLRAY
jgi:prepilin-type N-terminal cleavage/methylation domain-containing protein